MYIPDLFGAYTKGREAAIDQNWQDLKNYEDIESARTTNDVAAMNLLRNRAMFAGDMAMHQDQVGSSQDNRTLQITAMPGLTANTAMKSDAAVDDYGIYQYWRPEYRQTKSDMFGSNLGKQKVAIGFQTGQNDYLLPRAYGLGQDQGYIGEQTILGNKTTAGNFVNAAGQQINQSNMNYGNNMLGGKLQGIQTGYAIKNASKVDENYVKALDNKGYDLDHYQGDKAEVKSQQQQAFEAAKRGQIGSLVALGKSGDPAQAANALYQLQQLGLNSDGYPIGSVPKNGVPTNYVGMGNPQADRNTTALITSGSPQAYVSPKTTTTQTTPQPMPTVHTDGKGNTYTTTPAGQVVVTPNTSPVLWSGNSDVPMVNPNYVAPVVPDLFNRFSNMSLGGR